MCHVIPDVIVADDLFTMKCFKFQKIIIIIHPAHVSSVGRDIDFLSTYEIETDGGTTLNGERMDSFYFKT